MGGADVAVERWELLAGSVEIGWIIKVQIAISGSADRTDS